MARTAAAEGFERGDNRDNASGNNAEPGAGGKVFLVHVRRCNGGVRVCVCVCVKLCVTCVCVCVCVCETV